MPPVLELRDPILVTGKLYYSRLMLEEPPSIPKWFGWEGLKYCVVLNFKGLSLLRQCE
jgi:hypothetical protein